MEAFSIQYKNKDGARVYFFIETMYDTTERSSSYRLMKFVYSLHRMDAVDEFGWDDMMHNKREFSIRHEHIIKARLARKRF